MRIVFAILVVALALGCKRDKDGASGSPAPAAPGTGTIVTSPEYKFEAWFPEAPQEKKTKKGRSYLLPVPAPKGVFGINCTTIDKPVALTDTNQLNLFMVGARIGLLQADGNKGGSINSEEKFQFNGKYPGWKIDVQSPKFGIYRVWFIHAGDRFYQLIAAGPKEFVDGADATKFLNSFKLTD